MHIEISPPQHARLTCCPDYIFDTIVEALLETNLYKVAVTAPVSGSSQSEHRRRSPS